MAKDSFKREKIVEEAIPAAIKVKDEILDVRTTCMANAGDIAFRQYNKQPVEKELAKYQASITVLFQTLRAKFKKGDKILELDKAFVENKQLKLKELYDCWCILDKKIYDLKITKIAKRGYEKGRKLA